jgi:hypothetical protein
VLLGTVVILSYQRFSPSATGQNDQQPSTPASAATSLPRADSISQVVEPTSDLEDSPSRSAEHKVEEAAEEPIPIGEVEGKIPAQPLVKKIVVRNFPWAYLFVNGDSIAQMPRAEPLILSAGAYQFVFKKPQFPPILFNVVVDSTTADTMSFSLLERVAQVEVKVYPWAEIYIDGVRRGNSTQALAFYLLPGEHHFRFVHPQHGETEESVFLGAREVRRMEVNMFRGRKR